MGRDTMKARLEAHVREIGRSFQGRRALVRLQHFEYQARSRRTLIPCLTIHAQAP